MCWGQRGLRGLNTPLHNRNSIYNLIFKTEESGTKIIIVFLRNIVATPREMSKRMESSCP